MVINVGTRAEKLKLKLPDLLTRPVGRVMYESITDAVADMHDGETLLLDFGGIKVIDSSFIDEMIVRLIQDSQASERPFYMKLRNLSEIAELNIDLVFRSYSNYKNKKIVVITENICQNNAFFIGPLSDQERDIVEFMRVNKTITLEDAANFMESPREKARKLLGELHAMRIIRKQDGAVFAAV